MYVYVFSLVIVVIIMAATLYVFDDIFHGSTRMVKKGILSKRKSSLERIYRKSVDTKTRTIQHKKSRIRKFIDNTEGLILRADVKITFAEFMGISIMLGICGWLLGSIFNNFLIKIIVAFVFALIPRNYFLFISDLYRKQINEQLGPVISQITNLLPSKKTLINACESVVHTMEQPLKTFFVEFINNINNANRSFEDALHELSKKIGSKQFDDFERLALIHYRQGGDTVYSFNSIPENIRDIKFVQSEQEAELDSLRSVGYLFVFGTPLCLAYYYLAKKEYYIILTNSFAGKIIMGVVAINLILTVYFIRKLSKPIEM